MSSNSSVLKGVVVSTPVSLLFSKNTFSKLVLTSPFLSFRRSFLIPYWPFLRISFLSFSQWFWRLYIPVIPMPPLSSSQQFQPICFPFIPTRLLIFSLLSLSYYPNKISQYLFTLNYIISWILLSDLFPMHPSSTPWKHRKNHKVSWCGAGALVANGLR